MADVDEYENFNVDDFCNGLQECIIYDSEADAIEGCCDYTPSKCGQKFITI